jgi:hypothetical protein
LRKFLIVNAGGAKGIQNCCPIIEDTNDTLSVKAGTQRGFSFIEPMKALPVEKLPEGDWLYEIKHDGYRALAFKEGKDVRLVSRNQKDFNYPQLRDALKLLPAQRVILDGEIAALDEKGRSSFQLLQVFKSSGDVPLVYYTFDLLSLEGRDLRKEPLRAGANCLPTYSRGLPNISGSLMSSAAVKMICSGSRKSLASRAWSPNAQIQFTKAVGTAAPSSNSRSPSLRSSSLAVTHFPKEDANISAPCSLATKVRTGFYSPAELEAAFPKNSWQASTRN